MSVPHPRPWHRGSLFGDGPRRPLNREDRARFRFLAGSYRCNGRLSASSLDVGEALLKRLSVDGRCDPTQNTLARDAGCSERTVRRAIVAMKALGLLSWQQRIVRDGWRTAQTSNAYILTPTSENVPIVLKPRSGGQTGRQIQFKNNITMGWRQPSTQMPPPTTQEQREAMEELAKVRAMMEAKMRASPVHRRGGFLIRATSGTAQ